MTHQADIREALDDIFEEAGVLAFYSRAGFEVEVSAIFRSLTSDDLVSEHVMADTVVCLIRESELAEYPFDCQPLLGDIVTRELPAVGDCPSRTQALELAAPPTRNDYGQWKLMLQAQIRITP